MARRVAFHPLAGTDLFDLYTFIEERSGALRAGGFLDRVETLCRNLAVMPDRGVDRSDLGTGIQTIALERRVLIIYRTADDQVEILRVLYAGRDFGSNDMPS